MSSPGTVGSLRFHCVGRNGLRVAAFGGGLDSQEPGGQLGQGDVPVPAVEVAYLVVGHPGGRLREFHRFLHPPAGARHQHEVFHRGVLRAQPR